MLKGKELIRTNVMIDKELLDEVDRFAELRAEDRSTAIRQLLKKALHEERIELAVQKFREGMSFREAAALAGLAYWDFQAELDKREIPLLRSLPLARKRLEPK